MVEKFNAKDLLRQAKELKQTASPLETVPALAEASLVAPEIPVIQEPQIIQAQQAGPEKTEVLPEQKDSMEVITELSGMMSQNEELQKENSRLNEELGQLNAKIQCTYEEVIQKIDDKKVLETKIGALETRMEELGIENEVLRLDKDELQSRLEIAEQSSDKSRDAIEGAYEVIGKKNKLLTKWKIGALATLVLGFGFGYLIKSTSSEKPKETVVQVVNEPVIEQPPIKEEPIQETPVVEEPVKEVPVIDNTVQTPAYHKLLLQEIILENKYFTPQRESHIEVKISNEGVKENNVSVNLSIPSIGVLVTEHIEELASGQEVIEDVTFQVPAGTPSGTYDLMVSVFYSNNVEAQNLTEEFKVTSSIHDLIREKYGKK
ncbi:hypothetical protein HY837_06165 [archaeon]|nr:hypothetical protein [archaeon]